MGETAVPIAVRWRCVIAVGLAWAIRDYRGWLTTGPWGGGWMGAAARRDAALGHRDGRCRGVGGCPVLDRGRGARGRICLGVRGYRIRRKAAEEAVETVVGPGLIVDQDGSPVVGSKDAAAAANPAASMSSSE